MTDPSSCQDPDLVLSLGNQRCGNKLFNIFSSVAGPGLQESINFTDLPVACIVLLDRYFLLVSCYIQSNIIVMPRLVLHEQFFCIINQKQLPMRVMKGYIFIGFTIGSGS